MVAFSHSGTELILQVVEERIRILQRHNQFDIVALAAMIARVQHLVQLELYPHASSRQQIPIPLLARGRALWFGLLRLVDNDPMTYEPATFEKVLRLFASHMPGDCGNWFATGCAAIIFFQPLSSNAMRFPRNLIDALFRHAATSEDGGEAERMLLETCKPAWWVKPRYEDYKRARAPQEDTPPPRSPEPTRALASSREITPEACGRKRTIEVGDNLPDAKRRLALFWRP